MAATLLGKTTLHHALKVSAAHPSSTASSSHRQCRAGLAPMGCRSSQAAFLAGSVTLERPSLARPRVKRARAVVCMADTVEDLFKKAEDIEKRLQQQVVDGKVRPLSSKEAGYLVKLSDYVLLDVRPSTEHSKAWAKKSVWIPMYDVDSHTGVGAIGKKVANFFTGGWWDGSAYLKPNERFMPDVVSTIRNKDTPIVVACQKGLRSLAACEAMRKAGYKNLHWLQGGFDKLDESDFENGGPEPFRYAAIGGLSAFVGFTDVQRRDAAKSTGFQFGNVARLLLVGLVIDLLWYAFVSARKIGRQ